MLIQKGAREKRNKCRTVVFTESAFIFF